ncbi:hypothetical protein GF314_12770 [bacterium]|nr:hypothetical protein [bacterium]
MRIVTLVVAAALAATVAGAQTPFSLQSLGQNVDNGTARDLGRGGWGMADRDSIAPGSLNAAAIAELRHAQLLFSGFALRTADTGPDQDRLTMRTVLPTVRLSVPLREGRLGMFAGFDVKRAFSYESFESNLEFDVFDEPVEGNETYTRSGNLYEIPVGLAWRPHDDLFLGAAFLLQRGPVEDRIVQFFDDALTNDYTQRLEFEGETMELSMLWDIPGPLSIGASVTPSYDLDVDRTVSIEGVSGEVESTATVSMPTEYRAGFLFELGRHWRLGADGAYAAFGEMGQQDLFTPAPRDEWSFAVGLERKLVRETRGRGYDMPLRVGFQWRRWAYQVGGSPVEERAVSIGTGVPFRNWLGAIDASLSYVWIGSLADNGYESEALRLGLSISGLERLVF